jgi:hypothetical protein
VQLTLMAAFCGAMTFVAISAHQVWEGASSDTARQEVLAATSGQASHVIVKRVLWRDARAMPNGPAESRMNPLEKPVYVALGLGAKRRSRGSAVLWTFMPTPDGLQPLSEWEFEAHRAPDWFEKLKDLSQPETTGASAELRGPGASYRCASPW